MNKTFLVAVDGSDHGWKALNLAIDLAKSTDAALHILHVVPYEPMPEGLKHFADVEGTSIEEESARFHAGREIGDKIAQEAEARAQKAGVAQVASQVTEGNPADRIVAVAKSEGMEMIFMGSRGLSNIMGLLAGSVSHKVLHLAPCTCVAVK